MASKLKKRIIRSIRIVCAFIFICFVTVVALFLYSDSQKATTASLPKEISHKRLVSIEKEIINKIDVKNLDATAYLSYLHSLWLLKSQQPSATDYDTSIITTSTQIKKLWKKLPENDGWLIDQEFLKLYALTNDEFYKDTAQRIIDSYDTMRDPKIGIIYHSSPNHSFGYYDVTENLTKGLAMIMAGNEFHDKKLSDKGRKMVDMVYDHAYIKKYHTFAMKMDKVLLSNGLVNPHEIFFVDKSLSKQVHGNTISTYDIAIIIRSLLHTYVLTRDRFYLDKARDLISFLTSHIYASYTISGSSPIDPKELTVLEKNNSQATQSILVYDYYMLGSIDSGYQNSYEDLVRTVIKQVDTKNTMFLERLLAISSGNDRLRTPWSISGENPSCQMKPTCLEHAPLCLRPLPPGGWCIPTPTFTPSPTSATVSALPSLTLPINIFLDGIGKDNATASALLPLHPTRDVSIEVIDANNISQATISAQVTFDGTSGSFAGKFSVPGFVVGNYTLGIATVGYPPQMVHISPKRIPPVHLLAGDVDHDGELTIYDYNALLKCFSIIIQNKCIAKTESDLNDDGIVDIRDYTLILKTFMRVDVGGSF